MSQLNTSLENINEGMSFFKKLKCITFNKAKLLILIILI